MAIAYDSPSTAASFDVTLAADGSTSTVVFDGGTGTGKILVVGVGFRNNNTHTIEGITFNGDALSSFGAAVVATQCFHQMFYLLNPDDGELDLIINPSTGLGATAAIVSAMVFTGVDVGGTPYDGYDTANGTDATVDLTIASATGDVPFTMFGVRATTPTGSAETNYTERFDNVNGNFIASGGEGTGAASVAFTGTITSSGINAWVAMGANLNATATGTYTLTADTGAFGPGATTFALTGSDVSLSVGTASGTNSYFKAVRLRRRRSK